MFKGMSEHLATNAGTTRRTSVPWSTTKTWLGSRVADQWLCVSLGCHDLPTFLRHLAGLGMILHHGFNKPPATPGCEVFRKGRQWSWRAQDVKKHRFGTFTTHSNCQVAEIPTRMWAYYSDQGIMHSIEF